MVCFAYFCPIPIDFWPHFQFLFPSAELSAGESLSALKAQTGAGAGTAESSCAAQEQLLHLSEPAHFTHQVCEAYGTGCSGVQAPVFDQLFLLPDWPKWLGCTFGLFVNCKACFITKLRLT
jgi:hypothetical protein